MRVTKTALAADSRLHAFHAPGDFLDCYAVTPGGGASSIIEAPIHEIAQRIFTNLPGWVDALLALRDLGVAGFGLKTTARLPKDNSPRATIAVGDPINFLKVRSLAADEIILGEDDRHLDFRIAVRRDRPGAAGRKEDGTGGRVSLATWVRPHNRLGRIYLRAITPFHVAIVTARLRSLARHPA